MTASANSIRITEAELALFSKASRDCNPLHLSADYARKTAYGKQVVFGILGALAATAHLPPRPGQMLKKITLDFPGALYLDIDYRVVIDADSINKTIVRISDGKRLVCKLQAEFQELRLCEIAIEDLSNHRTEPAELNNEAIQKKTELQGVYQAEEASLAALMKLYRIAEAGVPAYQAMCLAWSSYHVGMEMPGRRALFSKLVMEFAATCPSEVTNLQFIARQSAFDNRFFVLQQNFSLSSGEEEFASGAVQSFVHQDISSTTTTAWKEVLTKGDSLKEKTALVIGGSRGLGAAFARALAMQGCYVYANFQKSASDADKLSHESNSYSGKIEPAQGNGADEEWCRALRQKIESAHGGMDILICNAGPSLLPLWIEPESSQRILDFVYQSVALTSVPMSYLAASIAARGGWIIVISSIAVKEPPTDWPHYVSAKMAVEGLTAVAAREAKNIGFLVLRPPRLLTDLTNTPLGRQNTISPEWVARRLVDRILAGKSATNLEFIEDFPKPAR